MCSSKFVGPIALILLAIFVAGFVWKVIHAPLPAQGLIKKGLAGIQQVNPDDFKFVVFSDSHENMTTLGAIVRKTNDDPSISFVISVGDMVSDPLVGDFIFPVKQFQKLKVPFLSAIGNHDRDKNDKDAAPLYKGIFGNLYYSFHIGKNYFAILDGSTTHGLGLEQQKWLEGDLAGAKGDMNRFVFTHMALRDPRGGEFSQCMQPKVGDEMLAMFKRLAVTHIFSGHIHGYFTGDMEGLPYTITGGAGGRLHGKTADHFFNEYVVVSVKGGVPSYEMKRIEKSDLRWSDRMSSLGMDIYHMAAQDGFMIAGIMFVGGVAWLVIIVVRRKKACAA